MNKNRLVRAGTSLPLMVCLYGCTAERTKVPAVVFRDEVRALPVERHLSEAEVLAQAAAEAPERIAGDHWQTMFDGKSLDGWRVIDFGGEGQVECRPGFVLLRAGNPFSGISWTNDMPRVNYEISLEAMRVAGGASFCGLTFPWQDSFCGLVVGGWGGSVVGLSNLDDLDASENETTQVISLQNGRWYHVRLRVTEKKIEAWIEQRKTVDVTVLGRKLSLPPRGLERAKPFGIVASETTAAVREVRIRRVTLAADRDSDAAR